MSPTSNHQRLFLSILFLLVVSFNTHFSGGVDTLYASQSLSGNQTITSQGGVFELGFFRPGNSLNYYVGIWHMNLPSAETVVWIANRNRPVSDPSSSELKLFEDGNLVLLEQSKTRIWSTNSSTLNFGNSTMAMLLDDGNFIVRDALDSANVIWQRFDYPTDTRTRSTLQCETSGVCGAFGISVYIGSCTEGFDCNCIEGFEPRTPADWQSGHFLGGCIRRTPLECANRGNDTFSLVSIALLPGNSESLAAGNLDECQAACLRNCSCTAFAFDDGCLIWTGALFNLQADYYGKDLYVRVAESEPVVTRINPSKGGKTTKNSAWIVLGAVGFFLAFFGGILMIIWRKRRAAMATTFEAAGDSLVMFKFRDIRAATKNFSEKLGEGGFGSVFKGTLPVSSAAIAVKALKEQRQEEKQFRAEVNTIGLIQHRNLVHLRGFCVKGTQRFLVYDYMPNGSLESHLFKEGPNVLDWKARYNIAIGTARGLEYLHEKCRDCIIHCDIKPENILLDADYNPKVADFGLAKLLGREFSRVLTTMRGTRGYLAPEWIYGEVITPKADVYSYGMMLFEIISGRRNSGGVEYFPYQVSSRLVNGEETLLALLDHRLQGNVDAEELSRACRVAVWCIQDEKDRPSMGQVVQVLEKVQPIGIPPIPRFLQAIMDDTYVTSVKLS